MKAGNTGRGKEPADLTETLSGRRLSALLSPVLIAFTVEADNEFELQMVAAGHPGAGLSLGVWSNALRFVPENGVTVRELAAAALTHVEEKVFQLGCLERWGFITLEASAGDSRPIRRKFHRQANRELRDGWGSGRGIRPEWMVRCTAKGRAAVVIWPELSETIEARWKGRFGAETVDRLRKALVSIVGEFKSELPDALPESWERTGDYPLKASGEVEALPLHALLSRALVQFTLDFQRSARLALDLCENFLRVLGETPIPLGEIARLTGSSRQRMEIGWRIKRLVQLAPDPARKRGKVVSLNAVGLSAKEEYLRLLREVEHEWVRHFGTKRTEELRSALLAILGAQEDGRAALSQGLLAPPGVMRSGARAYALGRKNPGTAALQRMRDMVEQTQWFVEDPLNNLPHYPLWDMNRGFGV